MSTRVFVVGTDTEVGKTSVCCALLGAATMRGLRLRPFKPAQSGPPGPDSDVARLLAAAGLPADQGEQACPHQYPEPIAPGIAESIAPFLQAPASSTTPCPALGVAATSLDKWESATDAAITLIEGAGGLHVPMPGGSWQPQWIQALSRQTVVVGREGLGTINHTLCTINGLRDLGRPPLGFILCQVTEARDASAAQNASIIAAASSVPHLGTLPYAASVGPAPELLDALLARL